MYKDKKSPPMALPTLVYRYVRCSSAVLLEIANGVGGADQYRSALRPVVVNSIDHYWSALGAVVVRPPTSSATECLLRRVLRWCTEKGHPLLGGARWKYRLHQLIYNMVRARAQVSRSETYGAKEALNTGLP